MRNQVVFNSIKGLNKLKFKSKLSKFTKFTKPKKFITCPKCGLEVLNGTPCLCEVSKEIEGMKTILRKRQERQKR